MAAKPAQAARETTISLAFPVEHDGVTIERVTIRRPTVRDVRAIEAIARGGEASRMDETVAILAVLTGLSAGAVDLLDFEDFERLSTAVAGFFPQVTGSGTGAA